MAISPNLLNDNFLEEVKSFESRIDSRLASRRIAPGGYVNIDVPSGMSREHFKILKERYIQAGWHSVEIHSDQREGEWLTFKTAHK